MSIGKSNIGSDQSSANPADMGIVPRRSRALKGFARRVRDHRRLKVRRSLLESLEQRHLMAGPNLVAIQPNEGQLLVDGAQLTTAPRELVFRFDDNSTIDPATLDGIRITRRGADNTFESASALSDVGTGGTAQVKFFAVPEGIRGEGITINFVTASLPAGSQPRVVVQDKTITVTINNNPQATPTQVRGLITALESTPAAKALVNVFSFTGSTATVINPALINGRQIVLRGANVAEATSDLGTSNALSVRFLAASSGPEGRNTRIVLQRADFGGAANPLVLVSGNVVTVRINSNPGNETTAAAFINAINSNPEASQVLTAVLEVGAGSTLLGNRANFVQTISLTGANDIVVTPGYVGIGNSPNEVVFRFAEALPQDTYQIDILGQGTTALENLAGEAFNNGVSASRRFTLNLGPKVLAVVPEPIRRTSSGLSPEIGVIEVHFDDDNLDPATATNPANYQLIYTKDTANPLDDTIIYPTTTGRLGTGSTPTVQYNALTNIVRLTFKDPLGRMRDVNNAILTGAARLRIGNAQTPPATPVTRSVPTDPGDSFLSALNVGSLQSPDPADRSGTYSVRMNSVIQNTVNYALNLPGPDAPGVRQIRPDDPSRLTRPVPLDYWRRGADSIDGITVVEYDFPSTFGGTNFNLITEINKERVREVLSLFSQYLGVQFVERTSTVSSGAAFSIVVSGNEVDGAPPVETADRNGDGVDDLVVMNARDFEQSTDDQFGGQFFRGAMLAIGQLLGYGYADGLPQPVSQSTSFVLNPGDQNEAYYPSISDIVNGQYLYRPDSTDIDMYSFTLDRTSKVSIQTFAERELNSSLLDTQLRLYRFSGGKYEEVAQNDDYFSNDSLIEATLIPGDYFVGVSASGNNKYDPKLTGTGFGGRSQGAYALRLTSVNESVGITDLTGVALDGDGDNRPGGLFDFAFVPANPGTVLYVDKAVRPTGSATGTGSISTPFSSIASAIAAATPGTTIRVLGNGGVDGRLETPGDAYSYQIGFDNRGIPLADGSTLDVPMGVRLVIDAGAVFKMRASRIGVGSTAPLLDRSDAAIQVLGTPTIVDSAGFVIRNANNEVIPGSVYFTSYNDPELGNGNLPVSLPPVMAGDWGGIDIRADLDATDTSRRNRENEGIFINHIQYADMRYGGGQVRVDSRSVVVSPIELAITRATIINNSISRSADAAISATPDTFRETRFDEPFFQQNGAFTPTISRVGPEIHGNTIVDNTINGLFVRVSTRTGDALQSITTNTRFDDTDIVHVIAENLLIKGTPGGPAAPSVAPSSLAIGVVATSGGGSIPSGSYVYSLSFASPTGESLASENTVAVLLAATGQVRLDQLPIVPTGSGFTIRRLYRASVGVNGEVGAFLKVADLNATDTSYVDLAAAGAGARPAQVDRLVARLDASLVIDPGTVVKLSGARIELSFGADLIAEGTTQNPIVITSLKDRRYGAGGTFDTNSDDVGVALTRGDWSGIFVGPSSSASLDHAVLAGAGGQSRIPGGFATFNPIEVHQGDLRVANSRFENNADGRGFIDVNEPDRVGRGTNASGTIFVRGSQPIIVDNVLVNGGGPAITADLNSFVWNEVSDRGRSTGLLDSFPSIANVGPFISGNRLDNNDLNGMQVRGGQVATELVWDDVDIVHIVRDTIEVPNQHIYGGLRLQSDARGSLVVKFENTPALGATATAPARAARIAGIVAGGSLATAAGQFVDIADRIGGSLQIVGQPDFPVILTTLADDFAGAGFTPSGRPQVDTNNNGILGGELSNQTGDGLVRLPTGPELDNGLRINNDVDGNTPGFFEATMGAGNEVIQSGVTVSTATGNLVNQDFLFQYSTFLRIGTATTRLATTVITQPATLIAPDRVESRGTIAGANGTVTWIATSYYLNGTPTLYTQLDFASAGTAALGDIQVISYLDEDVQNIGDDILYTIGTPGQADFRVYTVDSALRVGFSHGGFYANGDNQSNATYRGWAADTFNNLQNAIAGSTQAFSIPGVINLANLPAGNDPTFGGIFGPGDVTTAHAWSVDPAATNARVTSFLELLASDPSQASRFSIRSGLWNGITIREAANDRNVYTTAENETRLLGSGVLQSPNNIPSLAQFLGELAPNASSGDENRRLGFVVNGSIMSTVDSPTKADIDVYSFIGEAGTQVWLDIDRTELSLDTVLELIDANGNTLVLSNDSIFEANGSMQRLPANPSVTARSLNVKPVPPGSSLSAYQDLYSTNPRDAGMRIVLPGLPGQRNLYHVRVRSSNTTSTTNPSPLLDPARVQDGITSGNYQLQIRLGETDETPGTQIRYSDVRYATNGVQVIGSPRSPLTGDDYEKSTANDTLANAQPLGLFSVAIDSTLTQQIGSLASDRLSKSVGGSISSATDIDWYQFNVNYQNITRDGTNLFLSTIFDIDYADGFSRADVAIYIFNAAGQLILTGTDSNIADDQPTGLSGVDASDLSRGSAGTRDPYIGAAELAEGNYFIAIVQQSQIPGVLTQFTSAASANPLLRLEPIDSVTRIAEDRIDGFGGGTASAPVVRLLFNGNNSVVPLSLNDLMLYTLTTGDVGLANPFAGGSYGNVGPIAGFRDFAFYPNGELYGFRLPSTLVDADLDVGYSYFRINSETGGLVNLGTTGIETFNAVVDAAGVRTVVDSNDGLSVEAVTFDRTRSFLLANGDTTAALGFFVGNRPINRRLPGPGAGAQNAYFENILYAFDPLTGTAFDPNGVPNRQIITVGTITFDERANGAGTEIRERGYIETGVGPGNAQTGSQLVVPAASQVIPAGTSTALIADGASFVLNTGVGQPQFRVELDSGPVLTFVTNSLLGAYPTDGLLFSLSSASATTVYELDAGPIIVIDAASVLDGATITVQDSSGVQRVFEFDSNNTLFNPSAVAVRYTAGATSVQLAGLLATAISGAGFGATGYATPGLGRVGLTGESATFRPTTAGSGLSVVGATGVAASSTSIRVRENFTGPEFARVVAAATGGAVAGNRVNFRNITTTNITNLTASGIATQTGAAGVTTGSTAVRFLVSDTAEAIAIRIQQVINSTASIGSSGVTATINQNAVVFAGATLNAGDGTVSAAFNVGGVAPGGLVTGIAMIGSALYAVSDAGGLYVVSNPGATVQGRIGTYVATATELIGLDFTGLSAGPRNVQGGQFANLLFGVTASGQLYAFNTAGRLQPIFAGGATSVNVGSGTVGIDFSTLDFNLWHTTPLRGSDAGHGINPINNGTRGVESGGTSFYFGYESSPRNGVLPGSVAGIGAPRQDGQDVVRTYNFPGGAKGAIESNPVSLFGYSAADLPTLYFNYFLATDGVDGLGGVDIDDQDAFRVYVIDDRGVENLVTTNNSAITVPGVRELQPTFDNTDSWRQARVSLAAFAGQSNLRLRIEFTTGTSFSNLTNGVGAGTNIGIRTIDGARLADGQTLVIGGQTFEIDRGSTLSIPAGVQISNFYAGNTANRVVAVVGGVTYVLDDGTRSVNLGEVRVPLQVSGDAALSTFTAEAVATRLAAAIRINGLPLVTVPFNFLAEPNDEILAAVQLPAVTGRTTITGNGRLEAPTDVDLYRLDVPAGATVSATLTSIAPDQFTGNVRIFDTAGRQLAIGSANVLATYTATTAQTVVIGLSSNANIDYSPIVSQSGSPGVVGNYTASITVTPDFRVLQTGAQLQVTGGITATGGADGLITVAGTPGSVGSPIIVDSSMSAGQVALAIQNAVAARFSRGVTTAYPVFGSTIGLAGLTVTNAGPFSITGGAGGGVSGPERARDNNHEGVFVDDFIIGFAERGEIATGANIDSGFVIDPSLLPASNVNLTGTYQLEIRDASEYVNSAANSTFRTFDTNDRLGDGLTIRLAPASSIVDGSTFELTDGVRVVRFEFDVVVPGTPPSVRPGFVRIPVPSAASLPPGDDGSAAVTQAVITAINSQSVRSLINVAAVPTDGIRAGGTAAVRNNQINLFGDVLIQNATGGIAQILSRSDAGQTVRVLPATSIADGMTFSVTTGSRSLTFEFDVETPAGISNGVGLTGTTTNERILITAAMQAAIGGDVAGVSRSVAAAMRAAARRLGIAATVTNAANNEIAVNGDVTITNYATSLAAVVSIGALRGDQNRDNSEQGVLLIENSRFVFNSNAGIDIVHSNVSQATGGIDAVPSPAVVRYPRNLVSLNTQRLVPGVVVQSNVLAFNQNVGIQITGMPSPSESGADPRPFDRIINNTIVGGVITEGAAPPPATFAGVDFASGRISFADAVVSYAPGTGVSTGFNNPSRALGAPDCLGRGAEPVDGQFTVSLGSGGSMTVQFTDNLLTGSGDSRPDLIIFETGEVESVRVAISRDGVTFFDVGVLGGVSNTIDIDQFGFGSQDRFAFVRLTDLRQGTLTSGAVGADIDAIGALSTVPAKIYTAAGQGIIVQQNAAPTLLNNVVANTLTGITVDPSSSLSVIGGTSYYRNTTNVINSQATPLGTFAGVVSPSLELFSDPTRLVFTPRAGTPIIDASIDSLEDRASLAVVRNAIGLLPSPIIAPRLDVNGQLRVDDPAVETPPGVGDRVFKDRGAEDRADEVGPRATLVNPRASDLGLNAGQVATAVGTIFDSFDIQLIDGIGPADPTAGVGVDDATVTPNSLLLTKDGVPLIEGVDYRFGYDGSNNIIRLTPIAGIWENDSTYVVRLLDASDSLLRFGAGSTIADGAITTLLTPSGTFRDFEAERGITINVNPNAVASGIDGQIIRIFDGTFAVDFELNTNAIVGTGTVPVAVPAAATNAQIATALAAAIRLTALRVTANTLGGMVQLLGTSSLTRATAPTPANSVFTVNGAIGTRVGFGIGIPATGAAPAASVEDGQTFVIRRGANLVRTFELDFGDGLRTPGAIPVTVGQNPTLDQIAGAIVRAVGGAGLGLAPVNVGQGRVTLGGDANYSLDVSNSALVQLGTAGQIASTPVVIPINATPEQVVLAYQNAFNTSGLVGVTATVVGDRLVLDGVAATAGNGAVSLPIIRDRVGNLLQSGNPNGRTELSIFVGGGFDFGDAPAPYKSTLADGGPRARIVSGFSLGPSNTPDPDAAANNGDAGDDGIDLPPAFASGFRSDPIRIDVQSPFGVFYVDAWFDWNRDGVFSANEVTRYKSATAPGTGMEVITVGINTVTVAVPAGITSGPSFARFRLSTVPGLGANDTPLDGSGSVLAGEIEDYAILLQANRFQNPRIAADVNISGFASALDALNVINLLSIYNRNRPVGSSPSIDLADVASYASILPSIVNGQYLPDVNGDGRVTPLDALRVINYLAAQRRGTLGQPEGESFTAVAPGVLASALTVATEKPTFLVSEWPIDITPTQTSSSIFDNAHVVALDDILDDLTTVTSDRPVADSDAVDSVFSGLEWGL